MGKLLGQYCKLALPFVVNLSLLGSTNLCLAEEHKVSNIDSALFRFAAFKDAEVCSKVEVIQGKDKPEIVFPEEITNPAATCPDTYSWKVFLEGIRDEFWKNWAYDSYSWPEKPYRLCNSTEKPMEEQCCTVDAKVNPGYDDSSNPGIHCPYYPQDHAQPILGITQPSFKQHFSHPGSINLLESNDPGRTIRQAMAEVVYRNKPMWRYIFQNNFYNQTGLKKYFEAANTEMQHDAPYRVTNVAGVTANVEFPQGSVMFKGDWLHEEQMKKIFPNFNPQKARKEYITMEMTSSVGDNDANRFKPGIHYLLSMTMASKDLPNWLWFAIEHKDNLGRCDYTGCNDSFGYHSEKPKGIPYALRNFTAPHVKDDGLVESSPIFVLGKPYFSGEINPKLAEMMQAFGIGTMQDDNPMIPSVGDSGWNNYRLKGSQSEYTNTYGEATILGNSITEGGFVSTSSCLTCHVRASVNKYGKHGNPGGFVPIVDAIGYSQSPFGSPNPAWFMNYTENPSLLSAQFDYVWGILSAQPLEK